MAKPGEVQSQWWLVDATDKVVGRLASEIAVLLMGKHRPTYTPHVDTGDFVVVVNAEKLVFTGRKWQQKVYTRYTGHPGLKVEKVADRQQRARTHPARSRATHVAQESPSDEDALANSKCTPVLSILIRGRIRSPASWPASE